VGPLLVQPLSLSQQYVCVCVCVSVLAREVAARRYACARARSCECVCMLGCGCEGRGASHGSASPTPRGSTDAALLRTCTQEAFEASRARILSLAKKDPLYTLNPEEINLLWTSRRYIMHVPELLPLLLQVGGPFSGEAGKGGR
jgi:hypothetical protein